MQPKTIGNASTDLITAITQCDLKTQKLLRKADLCGRKAFFACDGVDKWHIVVLNLIQRIKRWFGSKEFANTRPNSLINHLTEKEIETILTSDIPSLKAAAYRITRIHKKWLTIKSCIAQLITLNKDIPKGLIQNLLNHAALLKKATKSPRFIMTTCNYSKGPGDLHHEVAHYFTAQIKKGKCPTSDEICLWGRLTEVLKRLGWDINGPIIESPITESPFLSIVGNSDNVKYTNLVDFYLEHGADPFKGGSGYAPAFYYLEDERNMQKIVDYCKKEKRDLSTIGHVIEGLDNVLEYAATMGKLNLIKFYVKSGMAFTDRVLYKWVSQGHDLKLVMPFLKEISQFTDKHLQAFNAWIQRENKYRKDSQLKELTIQDVEQMFNEAHK